jgi:hypothetical protein
MSEKKKSAVVPPSDRRVYLAGLDPAGLVQLLDESFDDIGDKDGSPYRQLYTQTLNALLKKGGEEGVHFEQLLRNVDAWIDVEESIRHAGFIVGFETCRQLMLGELDLSAMKGGVE